MVKLDSYIRSLIQGLSSEGHHALAALKLQHLLDQEPPPTPDQRELIETALAEHQP